MAPLAMQTIPWLGLRDPFSMLSHLVGALLAAVALIPLVDRARRRGQDHRVVGGLVVYGVTVVVAFVSSALFHAFRWPQEELVLLKKLDHAAIFLVIAGTGTAVYSSMQATWTQWLIVALWVVSLAGLVIKMLVWPMPLWLTSLIYVMVGWLASIGLFTAARSSDRWRLQPFLWGAGFLTVGAMVFAAEWPVLWPGVIEGHEVFHVLVLTGLAMHYWFVYEHCTDPVAFVVGELNASDPTLSLAQELSGVKRR